MGVILNLADVAETYCFTLQGRLSVINRRKLIPVY